MSRISRQAYADVFGSMTGRDWAIASCFRNRGRSVHRAETPHSRNDAPHGGYFGPLNRTPVILFVLCLGLMAGCERKREMHEELDAQRGDSRSRWHLKGAGPWQMLEGLRWNEALTASRAGPHARSALKDAHLGLLPEAGFELATGGCVHCPVPEAGLRYFRDEVIAVPRAGRPISGQVAFDPERTGLPYPPLVWIGAPEVVEGAATLSGDGRMLHTPAGAVPFALAPRIPTNRAYLDHSTLAFFRERPLRIRGVTLHHEGEPLFVARAIWPEDTRIVADELALGPLRDRETLATLVRAQGGGTREIYDKRLLWERHPGQPRDWAGRAVLAFVLNGAQGDDDGAHGGHLGIATGRFGPRGEWGDWLVANFYPIEERSEKGIITALVPMDNYLMDLNSGQAWYRPNHVLVAVLRAPRAANHVQAALQEVLHGYYCDEIEYDRAQHNSTAMGIDTLRHLGWGIPRAGVTSRLAGILAFPVAALMQGSLADGMEAFATFAAERTRLMPRAAFEAAGHDLLRLLGQGDAGRALTPFERMLATDVEAVLFVRFPQVPSSRRGGTYPVATLLEYAARVPWRADEREIVPDAGKWPFLRERAPQCVPAPQPHRTP